MPKKATKENREEIKEVKLDQKAQKALAYLSGIPATEEDALTEIITINGEEKLEFDHLLTIWLKLQEDEIGEIGKTIIDVLQRLKLSRKKVRERIESPEYLKLVRKSFRNWSAAESEEKRVLIRNLLTNAATRSTSPDFALFMFIDWLDKYSDEHFSVMRKINEALPIGLTRKEIWQKLNLDGSAPSEDSAEADMFKMLLLDLTTGYIIRQPRDKNFYGNFIRSSPIRVATSPVEGTMSVFESTKKYVLTELGKQFMTYTMEETPQEALLEESPEPSA